MAEETKVVAEETTKEEETPQTSATGESTAWEDQSLRIKMFKT
jgi:hypothetical protein